MTEIIEQIKQIIESGEIAQAALAREVDLSGGALSSFLNGKYKGDNQKIRQVLENWLEQREIKRSQFISAPDFIETPTAKLIHTIISYAHALGCITTVFGMSGAGKTVAAREYQKRHRNVWLVTASPSRASLAEMLYEIALALGVGEPPKRKAALARLIEARMKDTKGLLIIDEADHLSYETLEELRLIKEACDIGMTLIGNDKVYTRMRGGINQSHDFARLWSRSAKNESIQHCKKEDIVAIANAWQLDTTDKKLISLLAETGKRGGGLRILTQVLRLAWFSANGDNKRLDYDYILAAKNELQGGTV
ncbi:Mu phage DNA transposition protein B [Avibacterium paragallinarum]|uniref:Mu phage DNA transposition protein B n=1 Tax=Avibacterium paragallinarum TaxID=728 RepID=A0A377I9G0_AVIPA|nr:AAA family ATPase [Avibacterium paragallinarum]STO71359.1 Mu phage DNA transposition protein B [Avibacterium paragallinarum]